MNLSDFDDDVRDALLAERERPSPLDDAAKRRVTGRLVATLGGIAGTVALASAASATAKVATGAAATASRAAIGKTLLVAALAFGAGVGSHAVYTEYRSGAASTFAPSAAPVATAPREPKPAPSAVDNAVPTVAVESLPEAPKSAPLPSAPNGTELRLRERALLEAAQSALARGHVDEAIASAKKHAAEFPKSELAEEREAIVARALAKGGRCTEARAAVSRFVAAHPSSLQRASLERLCAESAP